MIRNIRKVFPIIFNTSFTALAVNSRILAGWISVDTWSFGIFKPFSFKNWIYAWLIDVRLDSYFETLLEKDDNVPPIRKANPEKSTTNPNITMIRASHLGILFFSSQEMGCIQMRLMKSASKKGLMIDFAKVIPAIIIINAAIIITGEFFVDPRILLFISK